MKTLTQTQIDIINANRSARQGDAYIGPNGNIWVWMNENRLFVPPTTAQVINASTQNPLSDELNSLQDEIDGKQPAGSYEVTGNKATDFTVVNDVLFPSIKAVDDEITEAIASIMSGASTFMFSGAASDIPTYYTMPSLPNYVAGALVTVTVNVTTTPTLLAARATPAGFPGITVIPIGVFTGHWQTQKSAGAQFYYSYFEIYKRNLAGTETLLGTSNITTQSNSNAILYNVAYSAITTAMTLLRTDRLVWKVYAVMLTSNKDIDILFDDNTNSRLELPFAPVAVIDLATMASGSNLVVYANNAAAKAAGLATGAFYRNGADPDLVCVVH